VVAEAVLVRLRRQPPVLRPLDLGRQVGRGPELERRGQPVRDLPEQQRLRRQDPAGIAADASAAEWKVDARTPETPSAARRARSSPAALSVNVTATSWSGAKAPLATCQAMRRVIVVVFPVPAPARMQTGPVVASTAARCSGFRPAKMRSASTG
jgi:hypothetical protein